VKQLDNYYRRSESMDAREKLWLYEDQEDDNLDEDSYDEDEDEKDVDLNYDDDDYTDPDGDYKDEDY